MRSKFSQIDARNFLTPQDAFLELVLKCIDMTAQEFLQRGRNREEVMAARQLLKNDPQPILDKFDAGLRQAIATWRASETDPVN